MIDEECLHIDTTITDSRWVITIAGWLGVRRRRVCRACSAQLETIEIPCAEYFRGGVEVPLKVFRRKRPRGEK